MLCLLLVCFCFAFGFVLFCFVLFCCFEFFCCCFDWFRLVSLRKIADRKTDTTRLPKEKDKIKSGDAQTAKYFDFTAEKLEHQVLFKYINFIEIPFPPPDFW